MELEGYGREGDRVFSFCMHVLLQNEEKMNCKQMWTISLALISTMYLALLRFRVR